MEQTIENIKEIAAKQRELPVWEKFETHQEDHAQAAMDLPPKMAGSSPFWFTTNMEYGRFQLQNRGFPGADGEGNNVGECGVNLAAGNGNGGANLQLGEGSRPQSTGGESYLDDQTLAPPADTQRSEAERVPTGVQTLPPVNMKYMAASRRGNREDATNRLTTGYAKQWMSAEHGRFWNNIQEVAPVAGYEVSQKENNDRSSVPGSAQVLTVE